MAHHIKIQTNKIEKKSLVFIQKFLNLTHQNMNN